MAAEIAVLRHRNNGGNLRSRGPTFGNTLHASVASRLQQQTQCFSHFTTRDTREELGGH